MPEMNTTNSQMVCGFNTSRPGGPKARFGKNGSTISVMTANLTVARMSSVDSLFAKSCSCFLELRSNSKTTMPTHASNRRPYQQSVPSRYTTSTAMLVVMPSLPMPGCPSCGLCEMANDI